MPAFEPDSLIGFASWCALQAVAVQRNLDDASLENVTGATPVRWRADSFEICAELGVTLSESHALGIQVSPINLGYRIARRDVAEADLRLTLTVDQRPQKPSSVEAE
jgi:hypothetical protein